MAIQIVSVKCPDCGATLEIEGGREFAYCSYCGSKVMMKNDNEYVYRNIDEARIKEAEAEKEIRLKELEFEEKEALRERKMTQYAYGVALGVFLIGVIMCLFGSLYGALVCMFGFLIAEFTYIKGMAKKKRRYVGPDSVLIDSALSSSMGQYYENVATKFRRAGFVNVTMVPLNDLNFFTAKKNGTVQSVSIDGHESFSEGEVFPKSARVTITYHSK